MVKQRNSDDHDYSSQGQKRSSGDIEKLKSLNVLSFISLSYHAHDKDITCFISRPAYITEYLKIPTRITQSGKNMLVHQQRYHQAVLLFFNCLRSEHVANKCSSNSRCKICERTYNTLLHTELTPNGSQQTTSTHVTSYNTYSLVKQNSGLLITAQLWKGLSATTENTKKLNLTIKTIAENKNVSKSAIPAAIR
uniref:Uncharacterized protein n=1 Tax=Glossina palpalis gambiensis TaxID=67801 RepID=A0A1B0BXX6_9MUSC